ncbi:MAG: methylated-DNA--[protein]-cysteine S-methyltransferase [Isosphaeraceae bacterium]
MNPSALYSYYSSPFGELLLTSDGEALTGLHLPRHDGSPAPVPDPNTGWRRDDRALADVREQLRAYFAGEGFSFDLPMRMAGTSFQRLAWAGLLSIPYGTTVSYGEQARRIGRPAASRAVGAANGRNPIAIIVPCHRVIGSDGSLTGYGGGLHLKRWLLEFEASVLDKGASAHSVRGEVAAGFARG